jgi:hypothetical protein
MGTFAALIVCVLTVGARFAPPAGLQDGPAAAEHDAAFWRWMLEGPHPLIPDPDALRPLALELAGYAASPDPVLRDEIGYTLTERWVRAGTLDDDLLRELVDLHLVNATEGLGEPEGDGVFLRAFAALHLALLVARDTAEPYLDDARRAAIVDTTLELIAFEQDRRGWIEGKGWAHVVAHAADVVRRLAENDGLVPEQHAALLETIDAGRGGPNAWGENDRLAAALQSLARRADLDLAALERLFERWSDEGRLARNAQAIQPLAFDAAAFRRQENARQIARALHARLLDPPVDGERGAALDALVLRAVRNL